MVIVFCSDENFVQHLYVSIVSLVNYNKTNLTIYVIDGGLSLYSKGILQDFGNKNNVDIIIIDVDQSVFSNFKVDKHVSIATYYRISIPQLLPSNITKVIYLDCDIIVNSNIDELWNVDIQNVPLAAVKELNNYRMIQMGLGDKKYFNAGVLLLNLKKWREENISRKVLDFISSNPNKIEFWDQDGLNAVLADDWKEISLKWNLTAKYFERKKNLSKDLLKQIDNPAIVHFNESFKPWHYQSRHPFKHLYYKYLSTTPFLNYTPPDKTIINVCRKMAGNFLIFVGMR